jgi:hypothetical protein
VSIDGGLHLGVAVWNGTPTPSVTEIGLVGDEVTADRPERVYMLATKFSNFLSSCKTPITTGVIEDVRLWWGKDTIVHHPYLGPCFAIPVKSRFSTSIIAARKGHTFFTAYIVGAILHVLRTHSIIASTITTQEWKGNYTKERIADRVFELTGQRYSSDHLSDAVGIGLAFGGLL